MKQRGSQQRDRESRKVSWELLGLSSGQPIKPSQFFSAVFHVYFLDA